MLRLILSGTFDRHPDLQIIVGHRGEVVLFYLERLNACQNQLSTSTWSGTSVGSGIWPGCGVPGAEVGRTWLDWQYLLGLPLDDPGFDHTVLVEPRTRVAEAGLGQVVLDARLGRRVGMGWLDPHKIDV